ncbi:MAG: bidirectional hydrogenase complex protein HoxE [Desulfobulbaceae bacterium]|nr:bidirectional hydrogenase complex protein HoxE [Desulfobulbaceae bacterium]
MAAETQKQETPSHPSGDKRFTLIDRAIKKHQSNGDALIEILHVAQGIFGYLEQDLLIYVARALKVPFSRVYGVATFYHFFRLKPQGEHSLVLCTGTACYVKGSSEVQKAVEHKCGCKLGETTADGKISLMSARCIGSCGLAPVAILDNNVEGKMTTAELLERIDQWQNTSDEAPA